MTKQTVETPEQRMAREAQEQREREIESRKRIDCLAEAFKW